MSISQPYFSIDELEALLRQAPPTAETIRAIIAKSRRRQALSPEETAQLILNQNADLDEEIFAAARELKRDVYGNRIVLFAPLYVGNLCVNDCQYCGFRRGNRKAQRQTLDHQQLAQEVATLIDQGHKRLILVFGEHPKYDADFIAETVRAVYAVKTEKGSIRRVNINAAPLSSNDFEKVHAAGIGTYQVFQETYHQTTFERYHPGNTPKGDYHGRLMAMHRAMRGGVDDVGIGVLFGLYDWRFEALALVAHANALEAEFGVGPHTISFPRLQPAAEDNIDRQYLVDDHSFKRLIAILRLAVPYTGLILTARESREIREQLLAFGVSQIDAGSRVDPGGYQSRTLPAHKKAQFQLQDDRNLESVILDILERDDCPSFCTACYRQGRTGEHFMEYAIPGFIQKYCAPNAILTLAEYLLDTASPETRALGFDKLENELNKLENKTIRKRVRERLSAMQNDNLRDVYF
jgi:2-iminoacetate synthase